jgi:glycosyltransferase involved in cell wall biosynthesis
MPARPLVSVIIPTFNRAKLCARAVRSALAQTYSPLELIVVDDGSTDGTAEAIANEFGDSVIVLRQRNSGVSAARNAGMVRARGQYIAFLDSDDLWEPSKLDQQVDWLERHPDFGMVLCNIAVRGVDGANAGVIDRRPRLPRDGAILVDVIRNPSLVPSTVLIRRQVYEKLGGFDPQLRTAEDLDFHMRVASSFQIGLLQQPLVTITQGDISGLSELACTTRDHVFVVSRFVRSHRHLIGRRASHQALFQVLAYNAWSAASSGRPFEALSHAVRALRHASHGRDYLRLAALGPLILRAAAKAAVAAVR